MLRIVAVTWMSVLIGCSSDAPFPPKTAMAVMLRAGVRLENASCDSVSLVTRADAGAAGWYVVRPTTAGPPGGDGVFRIPARWARTPPEGRDRSSRLGA